MSRAKGVSILLIAVLAVLLAALTPIGLAVAADGDRGISLATAYTSMTIEADQDVSFAIQATNNGKVDELVDIVIASAPDGWDVSLVNQDYGKPYGVRSVLLLAAGKEPMRSAAGDPLPTIFFKTKPPAGVESGTYEFVMKATTQDKQVTASLNITIAVIEKTVAAAGTGKVKLTSLYAALQGPPDAKFKFKINLANDTTENVTLKLAAIAPAGWDTTFAPTYEQTLVSAVTLKGFENKDLDVNLAPPQNTQQGTYSVKIEATSEKVQQAVDLTVAITGTPKLVIGTPTGQLNVKTTAGQESHVSIWALNDGTAPLQNLNFLSTAPEGWVVNFNPSNLRSVTPKDFRQIDVIITPPAKAVAGDYSVSLMASSDQATASMELRVTVGTATTWGWIGLGIVLLVVVGMVGVFWQLGRR